MESKMTRRAFVGFFLLGGFISTFVRKVWPAGREKKAMFWRKTDEV